MTGQNKKTQSTSQRKNRSSQGEAVQNSSKNKNASKNTRSSSNNKNASVSTGTEELKRKISELESKNNDLTKQNNELTKQNKYLQFQVDSLETSQSLNGDNESLAEVVSDADDSAPPAKRQMRKKPSEDDEKAKSIIKTLLKTFPELELKREETFRSKENDEICQKLIPKLQKEMKVHKYNPSYEQVKAWLKSIHGTKRTAYLKSNQPNPMPVDDEVDNSESDSANQSAKRQTKSKVKKPNEDDDELKNEEESKNDDGSKIDEGAKNIMKRLLDNTYTQDEYKLKFECTFKSQVNADICEKLIPKLQEGAKPAYNLSYKQVDSWLQNFHKSKRRTFTKSNQMDIDEQ